MKPPLFMRTGHLVFHISVLHKYKLDFIMEQQEPEPERIEVNQEK